MASMFDKQRRSLVFGASAFASLTPSGATTPGLTSSANEPSPTPAHASLIGFVQAGAGAASRSVQDKLLELVSPADFGALGDGKTDDTTAIQRCLDAALSVDFGGPDKKYKVSGALYLKTGHSLLARGAQITQTANNKEIFNGEGKSDLTIHGLTAYGVGTDHVDNDSSRAVFLYCGKSGSRINVHGNKLFNFSYTTVRARNNANVSFVNNYVEGPGTSVLVPATDGRCYGFLADAGCSKVKVLGNDFTKVAQGVRIEQVQGADIRNNDIYNIPGQHGCYIGSGCSDLTIIGNRISNTSLIGIKVQNANGAPDNNRVVIIGNTIDRAGDQGILVSNGAGSTAQASKNRDVTIEANTVTNVRGSAINVQNAIGVTVVANTVRSAGQSGVSLSAASRVLVSKNIIQDCGRSGIRDTYSCTRVTLEENQIYDCASQSIDSDKYGLLVLDVTTWSILNNLIDDANAKMQYGIFCTGGDQTSLRLIGNQVYAATDAGLRLKNSNDSLREYRDNVWHGTLAATYADPPLPSIASATTITLPQNASVVRITGTTNINSIRTSGHSGRTVVLLFDSALTITRGGNLLISNNFSATAKDTLQISCDGNFWFQSDGRATHS